MRADPRRGERGVVLLEAMVAVAILAVAGATVVAALSEALRGEYELRRREAELAVAHRVLTASTLLSRTDLDRRIGRHEVGELFVDVQRPRPALYRIAVGEVRAADVEMLVTVVYRKAP